MGRQQRTVETQMRREIRKVEATARENNHGQDVGTGQTILRLQRHQPPLRTLLEAKKIGTIELQAAEQIALAVTAVASRGILSAAFLERVSFGRSEQDWPHHVALAVRNYQQWANFWTDEWKRTRNPMLELIWSAVIDERPISVIAEDIGHSRQRTQRAIIAGLRHYAAWAGLVSGTEAAIWSGMAQHVFDRTVFHTTS